MFNMLLLLLISSNVLSTGKKSAENEVQTAPITGCKFNELDNSYYNERRLSNDQFTVAASSERDNYPITNAFDANDGTCWVAKDINTESFRNYIIINFRKTQMIETILYVTKYSALNGYRVYDGTPLNLTVYTSIGNEEFKPACVFTLNQENHWPFEILKFIFPQAVECDKLKIEFTNITICRSFDLNEYVPSTGGIYLIKKITDEFINIQNQINELFADYAQFELISTATSEKITELREKASKFSNYQSDLKPLLDRAEAVIKGTIRKDPHREFSTKPGSKNKIEQIGNSLSYCRNVIKFQKFGSNSQVIGIGGYGDKPITVFVDAEPFEGVQKSEVKLPRIKFTQKDGTWQSSYKSEDLKLGRNDLIFYNFVKNHDSYKGVNLTAGGPIHIENPYTPEEQKGHVTIYVEQGYIFPVFRSGDDEEAFKVILKDFYDRFNDPNDDEIIIDSFESISSHLIASTTSKLAYEAYVVNGLSPQDNLNRWDKYLRDLLKFSGLSYDPKDEIYDVRSEYVKENYRGTQPWDGSFAFAAADMVGFPYESSQAQLININNPGWAIAHETGHALDKSGRVWSENTNNMWSMHELIRMNNDVNDKLSVSKVTERLSSDFSDYVTHAGGKIAHGTDPVVWWILEGACPGYWGKSENMYVYEKSDLNDKGNSNLQVCERNIYYACLALKKNVCAYFERFGFYFKGDKTFGNENNLWTYEKSTQTFKDLLKNAIDSGRVVDECPKYWYVNLEHYRVMNKHDNKLGDWATCYSNNDEIRVKSIKKLATNYFLTLPEVTNHDAHLCYEVQSFIDNKWQVVGSTYSQFFTDTYPYAEGFKPKYRIIGYDRNFHTTKALENDDNPTIEEGGRVARIGEKYYDTLQAALDDVKTDDVTVYIMKSFSATTLVFNQNVMRIEPDPSLTEPLIISKAGAGYLLSNGEKCNRLYFGHNDRVQIILEGNNIRNKGNFINGGFQNAYFYNCVFRNNHNEEDGGAIYVGWDCRATLENSAIEGCSGKNGGAVFTTGGFQGVYDGKIELINSAIRNCVASGDGGAIYGSAINGWNNIVIQQNSIIENNEAQNGGAISFICFCSIKNSIIKNNKAHVNGGAIFFNKEKERNCKAEIDHSTFENNVAVQTGYTFYIREPGTELHLNGGKIFGNIYKADDSLIYLQKHQDPQEPPDFSAAKFYLNIPKDGVNLIDKINNYNVDGIVGQIQIENGYAEKGDDGTVKAYPNRCTLKVKFNNNNIDYEINTGVFTFPDTFEGFNEDYYITEWRSGGKTYQIGDKLNILTGMEFEISAKLYFKLTFNYGGSKSETIKAKQASMYYLPAKTPDGSRLFGYECSNGNYYAYAEPVEVTSDLTFTAVFVQSYTLTVVIGGTTTKYVLKYGEQFILPEPEYEVGGKFFKHWLVNGEQYQPKDFIAITADTTATAFYADSFNVKFIVGDKIETRECKNNEMIDLYYTGPELLNKVEKTGREFDYWLIEGKKYLLYSKYKVTKNVEIIAHYAVIDKTQKIEIAYEVPVVDSSSARSIKSGKIITKSLSYFDNLTFPDGEEFGDFGINEETSEDILFVYWNINGVRYNKDDIVGITTPFKAVAVTGNKYDIPPTKTPTPNETPINNYPESPIEVSSDPDTDNQGNDNKKGGPNVGIIVGVIVAVLVVIAAIVAGVIIYRRKKMANISSANVDQINSDMKDDIMNDI